tara:strand:- start:877 stop:1971 length:1095 start_codon:yes stop_codon:yes gene_type:complete
MFDVKTNKAICVLPWVHEYKQSNAKSAPCCRSHRPFSKNESVTKLRQSMLNGIREDICKTCYDSEDATGTSDRIFETVDWIKKHGTPNIDNPKMQFADIRFDPTCNLKCKTCNPGESTLWAKEKGVSVKIDTENELFFNKIKKQDLKKIYLAGGEPTYIKNYLSFLRELYKENPECEVVVNTNLKKLPDAWKIIISKFKNITIVCSCDAIDILGEYVRYPIQWNEFTKNVEFVSKNANHLQFNLVASNLTAHKIYETCLWMKNYSNNIDITVLDKPTHFSEKAVPYNYRNIYLENLQKCLKFPINVFMASQYRTRIQYLIKKYKAENYDKALRMQLKAEIIEQDSHRSLQLAKVDPFLTDWIMA